MLFLRSRSLPRPVPLLASAALLALVGLAGVAHRAADAATITTSLTSTHGAPISGSLTIDDGIDPGNLVITATLDAPRGDVRAILAHVADESLLDGLSIVGARPRNVRFEANDVGKVRYSQGLGLTGEACPCDFGIRFPAHSGKTMSITLTHATQDLTIALFYGQDFAVAASGIRVDQLGENGRRFSMGIRHALLEGRVPNPNPIPEPTTALLMALGLGALSCKTRSRR